MSRQEAINAKCKDCIYDPLNGGTWRKQTELCTMTDCALYPYRPLTVKSSSENSSISEAKQRHMAKMREILRSKDNENT